MLLISITVTPGDRCSHGFQGVKRGRENRASAEEALTEMGTRTQNCFYHKRGLESLEVARTVRS